MPRPTFLGIGAQKAGTSWLFSMVDQHPDVCAGGIKEIHFFDDPDRYALGTEWYEAQFSKNPGGSAVGECTPAYLWTRGTYPATAKRPHRFEIAERVRDLYPDVRLIVSLRDPVDRAISSYFHHLRKGRYGPSTSLFEAAREWPGIVEKGRYAEQVAAWTALFPADQLLFLVYEEDIRPDAAKATTLGQVFDHIGVDSSFRPANLTAQQNTRPSSFTLRLAHAGPLTAKVMRRLPRPLRSEVLWDIRIPDATRRRLADEYAPDVEYSEAFLGRSLPWTRPE